MSFCLSLPFRIFAAGNIDKIKVCMDCGEETVGYVIDNIMLLGKKKKEDKEAVRKFFEEVLERSLNDELCGGTGKMPLVMDFMSTELSFNYNPPMPLNIMDIISLSDTASVKKLSEKDVTTVEANVNLKDFKIALHPSEKFPIGLSLCPQQQQHQCTTPRSLGGEGDKAGPEKAEDDDEGRLTPTDIIFVKYRLEYGDKNSIRKRGDSDERKPKHFLFFTFSGIRVVSDGSTNTLLGLAKRISHPENFVPQADERNFGDDVTVDVKFCDIDFVQEDTATLARMNNNNNNSSPFMATVKYLPKSDAGMLYLQDRFTYKITQLKVRHENEVEQLRAALEGARKEVKDLEELLIGAKVSCATMAVNLEEANNSLIKARRDGVMKDARITQLIAEKVALGSSIRGAAAGSGNLASNTDIQNLIRDLNDKNIELSSECELLRVEVSAQQASLQKLSDDKNAHIERLQKAAAEREKTLTEENQRLKRLLAERDAQLEQTQKALLDRQILAEKLAQAEKQLADQRKAVDLTLKKSASKKICPTSPRGIPSLGLPVVSSAAPSPCDSGAVYCENSSTPPPPPPPPQRPQQQQHQIFSSSSSLLLLPNAQKKQSEEKPREAEKDGDERGEKSDQSKEALPSLVSSASEARLMKKHRRFTRGKSLSNFIVSQSALKDSENEEKRIEKEKDAEDSTHTASAETESKHKKKKSKKAEQTDAEDPNITGSTPVVVSTTTTSSSAAKKSSHEHLKHRSSKRNVTVPDIDVRGIDSAITDDTGINIDEVIDEEDKDGKKKKKKRGFSKLKSQLESRKSKKKKDKADATN